MQKTKTPMKPDTERSALDTPTDLEKQSTMKIAAEINKLVADALALYLKTKNFHWHMSGPHFRDYHLLLDEQATQIYATVDPLGRTGAQARATDAALDRADRANVPHQGQ